MTSEASEQPPWKVLRQLGEGGSGQVFLAEHPTDGEVAVKVLSDRSQNLLLEQEAKLLVRLRHRGIAAFLGYRKDSAEIFGEDRGPCFWMEYVAGDDFTRAVAKLSSEEKIPRLLSWFSQALEALAYLHGQDVLHGDLSPGNIRVDVEGNLKLIDFGMASLGREAGSLNAATLLYLAPERIGGKNGPACDLFSLGTLFFEAIAGVHPRSGCSSLREMTRRAAKPLADVRGDLAPAHALLARAIDRMILIDPTERFSRAGEVLEALRAGRTADKEKQAPFYPVRMLGASEVFRQMDEALAHLGARSRFFALHGVTGVGKSRFLRETAFQCALAGRAVREFGPSQFEVGLKSLSNASGAVFFRSLDEVPPAALSSLLNVRRRQSPRTGLLAVWEWNEDRLSDESRRVLEALTAHPDVTDLRLDNLGWEDTAEIVRAALGREAATAAGAELHRLTNGNPLVLLEFLAALRERGVSGENFRNWTGALQDLGSFTAVLRRRIAELPSGERTLLELLAAAHTPADLDDLLRTVGAGVGSLESVLSLERLIEKGLVALDADTGRYRLTTSGLEDAVLDRLCGKEKRERHASWWAVLGGMRDESPQKLHHALALGEGAFIERAAPVVVESLRTARNFSEALRLTEESLKAVRSLGDTAVVSRILRIKGNLLNDLGRYAEALQVADQAFALAASDEPMALKTVKYWLVTGLMHQNLGNRVEAVRRFERLLQEAARFTGEVPGTYAMRGHVLLGVEALRRGELDVARGHFEKALLSEESRGWRRAEILRNLASVRHREGDVSGAGRFLEEARSLYRSEEESSEGEYACWLEEGNLAVDREDFSDAEAAYNRAEAVARLRDDNLLFASLWNNQGVLERKRGDLARSLDRLTAALSLFRPLGNTSDLAECLKQNAIIEAEVGRFEAASAKVAEISALGRKDKAREAEEVLKRFRDGIDLDSPDEASLKKLRETYARLPKALQVSFEERFDYKKWRMK